MLANLPADIEGLIYGSCVACGATEEGDVSFQNITSRGVATLRAVSGRSMLSGTSQQIN